PYAFLDDAPLEERRTQAVYARRATDPSRAGDLGAFDPAAIDRVRDEVRPDPRDADELHDALVIGGALTAGEMDPLPVDLRDRLVSARRATRLVLSDGDSLWIAAERIPEIRAVYSTAVLE